MSETLKLSKLEKQLQQTAQENRETAEKIEKRELKLLCKTLRTYIKNELNIIRTDTDKEIKNIRKLLKNSWIIPLVIGLCLSLGVGLGSYGLMKFLSNRITQQMQELQEVKTKKEHLITDMQAQKRALGLLTVPIQIAQGGNQIVVKNQPQVWQATDGMWVIELKKEN